MNRNQYAAFALLLYTLAVLSVFYFNNLYSALVFAVGFLFAAFVHWLKIPFEVTQSAS